MIDKIIWAMMEKQFFAISMLDPTLEELELNVILMEWNLLLL